MQLRDSNSLVDLLHVSIKESSLTRTSALTSCSEAFRCGFTRDLSKLIYA